MQERSHLRLISMHHNGRMSRLMLTRIAWFVAALAAIVVAVFAVQNVAAGPEDRDLGPVVVNTHEPAPTPSPTSETQEPQEPAQPDAATSHPVQPAPPVIVEQDDDDDWDDDWDDDDDDDDWDDDDWDDDDDD